MAVRWPVAVPLLRCTVTLCGSVLYTSAAHCVVAESTIDCPSLCDCTGCQDGQELRLRNLSGRLPSEDALKQSPRMVPAASVCGNLLEIHISLGDGDVSGTRESVVGRRDLHSSHVHDPPERGAHCQ